MREPDDDAPRGKGLNLPGLTIDDVLQKTRHAGFGFITGFLALAADQPQRWLVLDATAVQVFAPGRVFVEPAAFPEGHAGGDGDFPKYLIVRAKNVAGKVTRAEYGMSGDSIRVELDRDWIRFIVKDDVVLRSHVSSQGRIDRDFQVIRGTAVYAQSEKLELAEAPIETPVCDGASEDAPLELDGLYQDLEPGRFVIVSGERSDIAETTGVVATEAVMITEVIHDVRTIDKPLPLGDQVRVRALPGDRNHTFALAYVPQTHVRKRLLRAFYNVGVTLTQTKPPEILQDGRGGSYVAYHGALVVGGCLMASAVGQNAYKAANSNMTYLDALEGAKSDCWVRCSKDLGAFSELWDKNFTGPLERKWRDEQRGGRGWQGTPPTQQEAHDQPTDMDAEAPSPPSADERPRCPGCGKTIYESKFREGEWYCNKKYGGCGWKGPRPGQKRHP